MNGISRVYLMWKTGARYISRLRVFKWRIDGGFDQGGVEQVRRPFERTASGLSRSVVIEHPNIINFYSAASGAICKVPVNGIFALLRDFPHFYRI